ncbi:MAG: 50S ribosomal protein L18 [Candidatus Brennerbacteria bacterium]|nr:50S ribosomal protein L18 [Candidatus Brennerbacteria bacterium]
MRRKKHTLQTVRARRASRVRNKIREISGRARLSIFRSNRFTVAQLIDDATGRTLVSVSSREFSAGNKTSGTKTAMATMVGKTLADRAKAAGIAQAAVDRGGYRYHGRIKALVEAVRAGGLSV